MTAYRDDRRKARLTTIERRTVRTLKYGTSRPERTR